jgi:recombinational DNA repair protein (RecF pathway)
MEEYVSEAIVLTKDPVGERDARYAIFTERFGKMAGRTTSSRKITSKLAGHLEPGVVTKIRFVETHGTRIVDALKISRADISPHDLTLLGGILPEMQADPELWELLTQKPFSWSAVLAVLGWDPRSAICAACGGHAAWFIAQHQEFFCEMCVSKTGKSKVSLIKVDVSVAPLKKGVSEERVR